MFGFDEGFQVVQACSPEDSVLLDPGIDGAQRFRIELVDAMAPFAVLADEVGAAKQAQVLGYCGAGDRERSGDLAGRLAATPEEIKNGAACRIRQCLEGGFLVASCRICNRLVTHNA